MAKCKNSDNKVKKVASIGGQAVLEGVMMRGPSSLALAVRDSGGEILVDSKRVAPSKSKALRLPLVRGVVVFIKSMVMGVQTLMKSAEIYGDEDGGEMSNAAVYFTVFLGLLFSMGLFMFLPSLIGTGFSALTGTKNSVLISVVESGAKLIIFIAYLLLVSGLKDIRRTYMYHGAEHKTINCYEQGQELTVANVKACSKRHDRCGTTFLFFLIMISIVVFTISNAVFASLAERYTAWRWSNQWYGRLAIRLVLLPLVAGLSYELLKFLAVLPDNFLVRILKSPGLALQHLTTKEPDEPIIEVAIAAFNAAQYLETNADAKGVNWELIPAKTVYNELNNTLKEGGYDATESDWALSFVTKKGISELKGKDYLSRKDFNAARRLISERVKTGKPLQYVAGEVRFWDYDIKVNPAVLIPRPETELLAEGAVAAVQKITDGNGKSKADINVLEIGTGSGAVAVAIADKTGAKVTAADISEKALKVAAQNTKKYNNITLMLSDVYTKVKGTYDVIVSNPPYIAVGELASLSADVQKEPLLALNGGEDGLDIVRQIVAGAPERLNLGGTLMLEIGYDQTDSVKGLYAAAGLKNIRAIKDYQNIDRIIIGEKH